MAIKQCQMDATVPSAILIHRMLTENQRYDCCDLKHCLLNCRVRAKIVAQLVLVRLDNRILYVEFLKKRNGISGATISEELQQF